MGLPVKVQKAANEQGLGGFDQDWPEPGHYQFAVTSIDVQGRVKSGILVGLEVVTGEVPGQEGKTPELFLWYDTEAEKWGDNAADRISRFFWACGIVDEGTEGEIEPDDAVGKTFIGKVAKEMRAKSKNDSTKVERTDIEQGCYWRIGHPDVKDLFKTEKVEVEKAPPVEDKAEEEEDDGLGEL